LKDHHVFLLINFLTAFLLQAFFYLHWTRMQTPNGISSLLTWFRTVLSTAVKNLSCSIKVV